jgi:RimJ/RimL family protein N-acetyltransferase
MKVPIDGDCELETTRLTLIPMVRQDAEELFQILKDVAMHTYIGGNPPLDIGEVREHLARWESRCSPDGDEIWLNWTLRTKSQQTVIGYVQASIGDAGASLAWVVGVPFQGRGYAAEASRAVAHWLTRAQRITRLSANIHPEHLASQSIARKLGLERSSERTSEGEEVWTAVTPHAPCD